MTPTVFVKDTGLEEKISDTTALAASLAAVSIAIFVVLPTFRSLVEKEGMPGFSEYAKLRRLFRGFSCLAVASVSFSLAAFAGIVGGHWPCRAVLYGQQVACCLGLLLAVTAVYIVWRSVAGGFT